MIKDDPQSPLTTERFYATGVTSAVDGWFFTASSDNTLYMLEDLLVAQQSDDSWQSFSLNLTALSAASAVPPATPYGVVSSPEVMPPFDYDQCV